ncbi:MAG: hypothetical protein ACWGQW_01505 [bacterium]
MKWLLPVLFLVACGGEEKPTCVGMDGQFVGVPLLDMNNCIGIPPFLRPTSFDAADLTDDQKVCGWSEILVEEYVDGPCTRTVSHRLDVKEDKYTGFIILDINCGEGYVPCAAIWRVEFEPQ